MMYCGPLHFRTSALPPFLRSSTDTMGLRCFRFVLLTEALRSDKLGIVRRRCFFIIEFLHRATSYLFSEDALDAAHNVLVFTGNEREGIAGLFSSAGAAGSTCTVTGVRRTSRASRRISSGMVAENSSVWRLAGTCLIIFLISGRNPMSNIQSASSKTSTSRCDRFIIP